MWDYCGTQAVSTVKVSTLWSSETGTRNFAQILPEQNLETKKEHVSWETWTWRSYRLILIILLQLHLDKLLHISIFSPTSILSTHWSVSFSVQLHFPQPPACAVPVYRVAQKLFSLATGTVFCCTVRLNDTASSKMNASSKAIRENKCFQTLNIKNTLLLSSILFQSHMTKQSAVAKTVWWIWVLPSFLQVFLGWHYAVPVKVHTQKPIAP